jgi:hypothetical protein
MLTRRNLLPLLSAAPALAQNIGFKADMLPVRSECGIGALMPWADVLWAVTYNSHKQATGSGLALYCISDDFRIQKIHTHNGTHANRLIHEESNLCFIGPYAIDAKGNYRVIQPLLDHRLTSTMRHLTDPGGRVYFLTMEGLLFECDVASLECRQLADLVSEMKLAKRPHFKGGWTGQGRVVVANNGFYEYGEDQAGLFEWDGKTWRRLSGKPHMDIAGRQNMGSVLFATGWDESSVLFWTMIQGKWERRRLPKSSHAMEHAWQTEWMRIREVETEHYLMDIQGGFFELQPVAFENAIWGVKPVCQHLRIIPDYCAFRGLLALAGNQTTPNQGNNPLSGQPQSGLWFGKTDDLWGWGKPQGWGGPWRKTPVKAGELSDAFLMTGYDRKVLHLMSDRPSATSFDIEVDFLGNGTWVPYRRIDLPSSGYAHHEFPQGFSAHWARLRITTDCRATAEFMFT